MSHTPGEWVLKSDDGVQIWHAKGLIVDLHFSTDFPDDFMDNARLMASAPKLKAENEWLRTLNKELVEACKLAKDIINGYRSNSFQMKIDEVLTKAENVGRNHETP